MPTATVECRELPERPILFVRLRAQRAHLSDAISAGLGQVFQHCRNAGIETTGMPFVRYQQAGDPDMLIEAGLMLVEPHAGEGKFEAGTLAGGPAAVTVHAGPYATLADSYARIEQWLADNGMRPAGPPWEVYLTDPGEIEDPADWRTEICWPVIARA